MKNFHMALSRAISFLFGTGSYFHGSIVASQSLHRHNNGHHPASIRTCFITYKRGFRIVAMVLVTVAAASCFGQFNDDLTWKLIGKVKPRSTKEIKSSNWLIGCETLDRDYANYDAYKDHIVPLGIKRIRLQGGWAKTEKVKGVYDFSWLDHIIDDALSKGLQPWLQTSYGNPIYPGGGGANLSAGLPVSADALAAWDKWVEALVTRYKNKVTDWEIWNEPNNTKDNTPAMIAGLTIRTLEIIKRIQPNARISGLALGHMDVEYVREFVKILADAGKLKFLDNITYHDYNKNPDQHYPEVDKLKLILQGYNPVLKLRQGENGAPSKAKMGGAIGDYDWTELSQAKWDLRRMLGDLGHDIETSLFTLIDLAYDQQGPIKTLNVKGLIESDMSKRVIRRKLAYGSVQNVTSVFDDRLVRIKDFPASANSTRAMSMFGYSNVSSGLQLFTAWFNGDIPANSNVFEKVNFSISKGNFKNPVLVDMVTGNVYEIPAKQFTKKGSSYIFSDVPVTDYPVVIADKSLIQIIKQ